MKRLYSLDYLRGLAAFSIMIYHYLTWSFGVFTANTILGRLGIYGVAIFYVLSGLTLYYVYHIKMTPSSSDLIKFFQKRALRILPLLWLVTIFSIIISRQLPDFLKVILNFTGLFGLFQWDSYYATGAWSIGNELVFYLFFPFFIFFLKKSKIALWIISLLLFAFYLSFAFLILDESYTLAEQWRNYVNPLNQVFLFLGGFLIGVIFENVNKKQYQYYFLLVIGLSILVFYPTGEDPIELVIGINRIAFTLSCLLICLCFYKIQIKLPKYLNTPLVYLGEMSFSVYLVHPLIYTVCLSINRRFFNFPNAAIIIFCCIFTLIASYFIYQYFEKYFMSLGKPKRVLIGNPTQLT